MVNLLDKLRFLYPAYVLAIVSLGYLLAELGHFLIGVTSKATAQDLHYGDISCQLNLSDVLIADLPQVCENATTAEACDLLEMNGTHYCEWTYNGLGLDYQILAGPSFIAVYTVVGVILGIVADRFNRVRVLAVCTLVLSIAILLMGSVKEFWHLVLLRMVLAAGYVPLMNTWDLGWRLCYYGAGIVGLIITLLTAFTLREPERQAIGEENDANANAAVVSGEENPPSKSGQWKVMLQPRVIMLCLAASIRHTGGLCFAYNCDLYYQNYFPDYDLGWWLFAVTIVVGSIGVVFGGVVSDKFVAKMGIRSRVAVLAISQLIATPFAYGSVYFDPLWALITLAVSYFFAEMWFGIVFAILVEIVPLSVRSTTVGVFLFVMNNIGGNLPILVDPVSKAVGYRESLYIFYGGTYLISSVMFLLTMFLMGGPQSQKQEKPEDMGHENAGFTLDKIAEMNGTANRPAIESSRL
ncbi:hypothetical protein Cfor_03022 [Coptotermes formosanus]|uniref:Major facilitator superfamily (MFS) profile domain-containing protein n=1 Tax=Coptotermes formosanus TaxID=36987 RepID=A0A6L2P927_COPFO|nr:hypothetical protein Cfor_03022 [Coptotermes formosanus]